MSRKKKVVSKQAKAFKKKSRAKGGAAGRLQAKGIKMAVAFAKKKRSSKY